MTPPGRVQMTLPVMSYYQKDHDVTVVNGVGEREDIFDSLSKVVEDAFKKAR